MELVVLEDEDDFEWHKQSLDVKARYKHRHSGEPKHYPCKVSSEWWDDPNGPYTYTHLFIYQQRVKCPCCGHRRLVWPEGETPPEPESAEEIKPSMAEK